jgi:hypothetical protein
MSNPLTREKFAQMVAAVQRIGHITTKSIKEQNDDAELTGQRNFLARAMLEHSGELLQAWHVMAEEYTPLVRGFAAVTERAAQLKEERIAQFNAAIAAAKQAEQLPQAQKEIIEGGSAEAINTPTDPNIIAPDFKK